jgi:hypothetical protein
MQCYWPPKNGKKKAEKKAILDPDSWKLYSARRLSSKGM